MRCFAIAGLLALAAPSLADEPPRRLFIEGQQARQSYNNVRIPGEGGTLFSLRPQTGGKSVGSMRITYLSAHGSRGLRLLYAPLSLRGSGPLSAPTDFAGASFAAGAAEGRYQFNSYRASWYRRRADKRGEWRLGVTLKVRDADIALRQGATFAHKYDLGVVPLVYFGGERRLSERLTLHIDADGLIGPGGGRAFDAGASLGWRLNERVEATLGVRVLEGGADNEKVYNFARFNYLSAGLSWRW